MQTLPSIQSPTGKVTKGELSRQRVLGAAARVFRQYGYRDTTIRDIAREAGIGLGSLYFHFRSKDELVGEVLMVGMANIMQKVRDAVDALPTSTLPRQRIEVAIKANIEAIFETGEYSLATRNLLEQVPPEILAGHIQRRDEYREFWMKLIQDGQDQGVLRRDISGIMMVFFLQGALSWIIEWYDPSKRSLDALARDFASFFLDGTVATVALEK